MSVSKLSEELVKAGCEIEVFTTTANGSVELLVHIGEATEVDGVKVTYFKRLTGDHTHYSPDLLAEVGKRIKDFDLVHIHAWWNLVSLLACRIAIKQGIPVVISPRGTLSNYSFGNKNALSKKLIHRLLGRKMLYKSYIHVTSQREERAMEILVKTKKIFNIPNFIGLPDKMPSNIKVASQPLKMIFFSRIEQKKGLELLFSALNGIAIPYRLTIAGGGDVAYINKLKEIAKKNKIEENLDWIGFRTYDKFDILEQHDLFLLPSYDENFGNSVIESLSVGTAVLISQNVGLSNYVQENNIGWVCEHDAVSFNRQLCNIYENKIELGRIRLEAPMLIRKDFNEAMLTKRYIKMYKEIINNG